MKKRLRMLRLSTLAIALGVMAFGVQAGPWVSTPTSDRIDNRVMITGGGLPVGKELRLSLVDTRGNVVQTHMATVDENGGRTFDLPIGGGSDGFLLEVWEADDTDELPLTSTYVMPGGGVR